jgi:hypothetical protein
LSEPAHAQSTFWNWRPQWLGGDAWSSPKKAIFRGSEKPWLWVNWYIWKHGKVWVRNTYIFAVIVALLKSCIPPCSLRSPCDCDFTTPGRSGGISSFSSWEKERKGEKRERVSRD